jgi:hypothetical protein
VVEPNAEGAMRYAEQYELFKASYLALEPVYNRLGKRLTGI